VQGLWHRGGIVLTGDHLFGGMLVEVVTVPVLYCMVQELRLR
jgi:hypothetical protein